MLNSPLAEGYRLEKRAIRGMFIGLQGMSAEARERRTHEWMLVKGSWFQRKHRIKLFPKDGQLLTQLCGTREGRRIAELLARTLISLHAVNESWNTLAGLNAAALQVRITSHERYPYERVTRTLTWTDDIGGPTPPPPSLVRSRQMRPRGEDRMNLSRRSNLNRKHLFVDEAEQAHRDRARPIDVEFVRPDLFQEVEPFVTAIMARGREAKVALKELREEGEALRWAQYRRRKDNAHIDAIADVAAGATAVRELEGNFVSPGSEEIERLRHDRELDEAAEQAGVERWRELNT